MSGKGLGSLLKDARGLMDKMKEEDFSIEDIIKSVKLIDLRLKKIDLKLTKVMKKLEIETEDE